MTTSTPTRRGTRQIDRALNHFLATREGARRFHKAEIGEGVDPDYSFGDWLGKVRASDDAGIRKTYGAALGERWQDDLASSGVRVKLRATLLTERHGFVIVSTGSGADSQPRSALAG